MASLHKFEREITNFEMPCCAWKSVAVPCYVGPCPCRLAALALPSLALLWDCVAPLSPLLSMLVLALGASSHAVLGTGRYGVALHTLWACLYSLWAAALATMAMPRLAYHPSGLALPLGWRPCRFPVAHHAHGTCFHSPKAATATNSCNT